MLTAINHALMETNQCALRQIVKRCYDSPPRGQEEARGTPHIAKDARQGEGGTADAERAMRFATGCCLPPLTAPDANSRGSLFAAEGTWTT